MSALDADDTRLVVETCARRAELELRGSAAFVLVTSSLRALDADPAIIDLSARAVEEERRHAEIYRRLAEHYAGHEVGLPLHSEVLLPSHGAAPAALRPALHVVGMCAINETMACAFLDLCRKGARDPMVRDGLHEVLSDEIVHGRIGWAWLSTVSPTLRATLAAHVLPLLKAQVAGWREQLSGLPARGVPEHGCPSRAAIEHAAMGAIGDLILPGFDHLGMDVSDAWAWQATLS